MAPACATVEAFPRELRFYERKDGRVPVLEWLNAIEGHPEYFAIMVRLDRVEKGNFGDHRSVGEGVSELKIGFGLGYRIYYGQVGMDLVVLLAGGPKSTQDADIRTAKEYWRDFNA